MRVGTTGELRRVDLGPLIELLPALRAEWADLRFDAAGAVVNPITGHTATALSLVDGRHRQVGARYRVTITTPKMDLPEDRRGEFEDESRKLRRRNAKQAAWDEHFARLRQASVQVGIQEHHLAARIRDDSERRLAFSLTEENESWTLNVDLEHGRLPKVAAAGAADLTALLRAEGTPGCFAGFFGGTAKGSGTVDASRLERDGRVIEANGRANRFRGDLIADVRTSSTTWTVEGKGSLRARGLARPIMWFAGRRIRRTIEASLAEFWSESESRTRDLSNELVRLRAAVVEEGGPVPFVHRALWDDGFDPGVDLLRRDRDEP